MGTVLICLTNAPFRGLLWQETRLRLEKLLRAIEKSLFFRGGGDVFRERVVAERLAGGGRRLGQAVRHEKYPLSAAELDSERLVDHIAARSERKAGTRRRESLRCPVRPDPVRI